MTVTPSRPRPASLIGARPDLITAAGVATAIVALAFLTSSGTDPSTPIDGAYTWSLIALVLLSALACATPIARGVRGSRWGAGPIVLFAAFAALAALSIIWSIQPDWSWYGANQLVAYFAAFAGAAALARTAPERWPGLVGGIAAGATVLCVWSLLAKVFPASLDPSNTRGRLLEPFGYWNAIGVVAALGLPACLWAGTRPSAPRLQRVICPPALTLGLTVVVLSYSRSAVLSAIVGCGLWLVLAPRRLRSVAILAIGAAGAIPAAGWMLHQPNLKNDSVAPSIADSAGHTFGVVILVTLLIVTAAGVAMAIAGERVVLPDQLRRRIGTVLLCLAALIPVAGVLAMAASSRGLTGEISHLWNSLTSTSSVIKDNSARLSELGSSRPLYWSQAFSVFSHHLLAGAGALAYGVARLRYTTAAYAQTMYAHGYIFQTLADFGLVGLTVTLALLAAWCRSAVRTLAPWRSRAAGEGEPALLDEWSGLIALGAIVVAFGVQSLLDWTWYFPGVSVPVLLGAGWLAGRGPLVDRRSGPAARIPRLRERPGAGAAILGVALVTLVACWLMWEPLHSAQGVAAAETASTNEAAFTAARGAATADPLSIAPLQELSILYQGLGNQAAARRELAKATGLQPDNPQPWLWLGQLDVKLHHPRPALREAGRVLDLDISWQEDILNGGDETVHAAEAVISQARTELATQRRAGAQRRARANSRRRHSGGPPAVRTSTAAN